MPPADDAHPSLRPRSPRLVRVLLLGACGAGLLGLGVPGNAPTVAALSPAASVSLVAEPAAPHGAPIVARPVPQRASRSRAVTVKKVTHSHPAKKAVSNRWVRPSYAGVVSSYGMRWGRMHKGIDFGAGYGASIRAAADGVVVGSGYMSGESGYGLITLIRHKNGVVTAYAHQASSSVDSGDRVSAGEIIGRVGSSGHSTGAHLHFEVRMSTHSGQVNPLSWLREHGVSI